MLKDNNTLTHLQLALNHIGSDGVDAFVDALSGNTTLGELNMAFVPVREAVGRPCMHEPCTKRASLSNYIQVRRRISEVTQASDNLITCRASLVFLLR